jgi:hypothetical protein
MATQAEFPFFNLIISVNLEKCKFILKLKVLLLFFMNSNKLKIYKKTKT